MTQEGIVTEDGTLHELDVLVFATGFDAVDGNYVRVDLRGRDGRLHQSALDQTGRPATSASSRTGFPNMFMILGPNGPFTNLPPDDRGPGGVHRRRHPYVVGHQDRKDRRQARSGIRMDRDLPRRSLPRQCSARSTRGSSARTSRERKRASCSIWVAWVSTARSWPPRCPPDTRVSSSRPRRFRSGHPGSRRSRPAQLALQH